MIPSKDLRKRVACHRPARNSPPRSIPKPSRQAVRTLANKEGRQLQALVDEALTDLIEKHKNAKPRPHVLGAYLASHEKYGPLYKKLAE